LVDAEVMYAAERAEAQADDLAARIWQDALPEGYRH